MDSWPSISTSTLRALFRPPHRPAAALLSNALDEEREVEADPCAGWELGSCEVIRRLAPGEAKTFLALRSDASGASLVVLKRTVAPVQALFTRAQWAAGVQHPHLARVYDCEVSDDDVFWVTEFVPGATLAELADACRKKGMSVPLGIALAAVHETALALDALHGGRLSGQVRDRDIVVTFAGSTRLRVAPTASGTGLSSLGAILYQCVSGEEPSGAHLLLPSRMNIAVTPQLDDIILRALERPRTPGFRTAGEFAHALKQHAASFMWRESQRADFLADLFQTRWRRVQVLTAGQLERAPLPPRPPAPMPRPGALTPPLLRAVPLAARTRVIPVVLGRLLPDRPRPRVAVHRIPRPQPRRRLRRPWRSRWRAFGLLVGVAATLASGALRPSDLDAAAEWARSAVTRMGQPRR